VKAPKSGGRIKHDGPLIIGGGLAGLSAALEAAPAKVLLISPAPLLQSASSAWAQGGVAAALAFGDDPALHAADTEAAGAGLVDAEVVRTLTEEGRATVEWLAALGAPFDREADGRFSVSREAAHSMARVARVGGDGAGRAILSALVTAVRAAPHIEVWEDARLRGLLQDASGRISGAVIERGLVEGGKPGRTVEVTSPAVVLATGGAGGLFGQTTTPAALLGEGLALAWMAGAEVLDPEFVQFHPTAMDVGLDPMPLATEALRGEGARLIDRDGVFLLGEDDEADLAPRDVVARAVHAARASGRGAFLDARTAIGEEFPHAFPAVFAACMRAGIDPRETPIPVAAAAHYHMGGITADADGRTTLAGLYAVGECAATGVHGANRLASNSLLEAATFGRRTGRTAAAETAGGERELKTVMGAGDLPADALHALRMAMSVEAGVIRDAAGLTRLLSLIGEQEAAHGAALPLTAARLIAEAALARHESRGGHYRSDYPQSVEPPVHTRLRRLRENDDAEAAVLATLAAI